MKTIRVGPIVAIAIFVVVLTFFLGRALLATAGESRPASLPPSSDIQDWLTYTDERFNFSVQYPPDWYINIVPADAAGGGVQISTHNPYDTLSNQKGTPADYIKIEIMVVGGDPIKNGQSLTEWRHARLDYVPLSVKAETLTYINGLESLEEKVEYFPGTEITTIYFKYFHVTYGETVIFISATPFQQQVMEETFRKIVSTFQVKK